MVRAVVSESENRAPFPVCLLTPSVTLGESLPSIGPCFLFCGMQGDLFPPAFAEDRVAKEKEIYIRQLSAKE